MPQIKVGQYVFRRYKNTLFLTSFYQDISDWQVQVDISYRALTLGDIVVNLPDNVGTLVFNASTAQKLNSANKSSQNIPIDHLTMNQKTLPGIALPKAAQQVTIRFSHDNPTCLPHFRQHSRSVKKVLQELNIAPWERKRIPFLYYDNVLVAAIGHFICQSFIEHDSTLGIKIVLLN